MESSFRRIFVILFYYLDLFTIYSLFCNRLVRFWNHHLVVQREIAPLLTPQLTEFRSYYAKLPPSVVKVFVVDR